MQQKKRKKKRKRQKIKRNPKMVLFHYSINSISYELKHVTKDLDTKISYYSLKINLEPLLRNIKITYLIYHK